MYDSHHQISFTCNRPMSVSPAGRLVSFMPGVLMQLHFEVGDIEYLKTCARIRNISLQALMRRLVDAITEDHLVQGILDDADDMKSRRKGEHRYREASA